MIVTKTGADIHLGHKFMARLRAAGGTFPYAKDFAPYVESDIYKAVQIMDEIILSEWNDSVGPRDIVYFLGDLSFHDNETTEKLFKRLNGEKHLVVGNHDSNGVKRLGWKTVTDFRRISYEGKSFWCMHYPMLTWPNAHKGTYHLHGHTHGNLHAPESTRMDVGVDCTGQILISLEECKRLLDAKAYDFVDHHRD